MNVYKVIFARNAVLACHLITSNVVFQGAYYYEHDKGKLIYALIRADNEQHALSIAENIMSEVNERVFGRDYIM